MSDRVTLLPVDAADVTILVDNFVDILLPGTEMVRRAPLAWDWSEREQLIAEHGYSLLHQLSQHKSHLLNAYKPEPLI